MCLKFLKQSPYIWIGAFVLSFASCADQNFDWEAAYRQNVDYAYKETFQSIFGNIDPDQSWDFSLMSQPAFSRAGSNLNFDITTVSTTESLYPVQDLTLTWMQEHLPEGDPYTDDNDAFELYSPGKPIFIIPIFEGDGSLNYDLHMVVNGTDDRVVWHKNENIKVLNRTGDSADFPFYNIIAFGNNGEYRLEDISIVGGYYSNVNFVVVTKDHIDYLFHVSKWNNDHAAFDGFYKVDDNGNISIVRDIAQASPLDRSGNHIKLGNYYLIHDYLTLRTSTTAPDGDASKWYFEARNGTGDLDMNHQQQVMTQLAGVNSDTSLGTFEWSFLPYNEVDKDDKATCETNTLNSLQIMSPVYKVSGLPANTRFEFYLEITGFGNETSKEYAYRGEQQKSNDAEHPMMVVLKGLDTPSNLNSYLGEEDLEAMLLACEDSKGTATKETDWDYNDVVFMIASNPLPSKVPFGLSKRYMVEDLGTDENRTIAGFGKTDMDFNDIVVDFIKSTAGEKKGHQLAIVRALGGTIDFDLYVGDHKVFTKSKAHEMADITMGDGYTSFNPSTMYNTGYESDKSSYSGHFDPNATLATIDLGTEGIWDPNTNNIKFKLLLDQSLSEDVVESSTLKEISEISFPPRGDVPRIIAFDPSKVWKHERQPIDLDWILNDNPGYEDDEPGSTTLYNITVVANNDEYGTVTGGGSYANRSSITITATPKDGYYFEGWSDGSNLSTRRITVTGDKTYTAVFSSSTPEYDVTVKANNSDYGSISGSNSGKYEQGSMITATATPAAGYGFRYWTDGTNQYTGTTLNNYEVRGNVTLEAVFAKQYTVTLTAATIDGETVGTVQGAGTYLDGDKREIKAIASANNVRFDHWSDGNSVATRTIDVTQDITLTAHFVKFQIDESIAIEGIPAWVPDSGEGGGSSGSGGSGTAGAESGKPGVLQDGLLDWQEVMQIDPKTDIGTKLKAGTKIRLYVSLDVETWQTGRVVVYLKNYYNHNAIIDQSWPNNQSYENFVQGTNRKGTYVVEYILTQSDIEAYLDSQRPNEGGGDKYDKNNFLTIQTYYLKVVGITYEN